MENIFNNNVIERNLKPQSISFVESYRVDRVRAVSQTSQRREREKREK
jgi:hypothetical protein